MTPAPAVRPLPYFLVWLPAADAHVHWRVLLLGWTPEAFEVSAEVFGVPVQLLNFEPPGVSFAVDWADWLVPAEAEVLLEVLLLLEVSSFFA